MVSKYLLCGPKGWQIILMTKETTTFKDVCTAFPGARMAGDERRSQILRVAWDVFPRGFRGTTTKKIAQAAGVSEAMVFRHFATKEELYAAILDHKACSGDAIDPKSWWLMR